MIDRLNTDLFEMVILNMIYNTLALRTVNHRCREEVDASEIHLTLINTRIQHHTERFTFHRTQYQKFRKLQRADMVTGYRFIYPRDRNKIIMNRHKCAIDNLSNRWFS